MPGHIMASAREQHHIVSDPIWYIECDIWTLPTLGCQDEPYFSRRQNCKGKNCRYTQKTELFIFCAWMEQHPCFVRRQRWWWRDKSVVGLYIGQPGLTGLVISLLHRGAYFVSLLHRGAYFVSLRHRGAYFALKLSREAQQHRHILCEGKHDNEGANR